MKRKGLVKVVALAVALMFVFQPVAALAGEYEQGLADGEAKAIEHLDNGRKAGWCALGFLTGFIGTGV